MGLVADTSYAPRGMMMSWFGSWCRRGCDGSRCTVAGSRDAAGVGRLAERVGGSGVVVRVGDFEFLLAAFWKEFQGFSNVFIMGLAWKV